MRKLAIPVLLLFVVGCVTMGQYTPSQQRSIAWSVLERVNTKTDLYLSNDAIDVETAKEIREKIKEIEIMLVLAKDTDSADTSQLALDMAIALNDYLLMKGAKNE